MPYDIHRCASSPSGILQVDRRGGALPALGGFILIDLKWDQARCTWNASDVGFSQWSYSTITKRFMRADNLFLGLGADIYRRRPLIVGTEYEY